MTRVKQLVIALIVLTAIFATSRQVATQTSPDSTDDAMPGVEASPDTPVIIKKDDIVVSGEQPAEDKVELPCLLVDIWTVRENLNTVIQIAEKGDEGFQEQVFLLIDQILHMLRSPKPGGAGYYYAGINTEDPIVVDIADTKVDAVLEDGMIQKVSGQAATPFAFEIYSPPQRAAFKNNGDTFVKAYRVELILDGAKKTVESKFEDWVHRKDSHRIPLPGIAQWAKLEIDASVKRADVNHAIIKLQALLPRIDDDPRNPYSFSINELKSAREYNELVSKRKTVVHKLKSALEGLDHVPGSAVTAKPDFDKETLIQQLDYVLFLVDGNDDERAEAKSRLTELLESLRGSGN